MGKMIKGIFGGGDDGQVKAAKEANRIAEMQAKNAEREMNKANAKSPDVDSIRAGNAEGISSTLLTGAGGVQLDDEQKKKKTLLGD